MKPPLTEQDYVDAAEALGVDVPAIKAVAEVESRGDGFLDTDEPKILFERHIFHRLTKGKYDALYPDISRETPGGYGLSSQQHARLARAAALDREAALQSASWGRFQVMGMNWQSLRYKSLQEFVNAMYRSEKDHLDSFIRFVEVNGLTPYLKTHHWAKFARGYNGKNYSVNRYDKKMANAYARHGGK